MNQDSLISEGIPPPYPTPTWALGTGVGLIGLGSSLLSQTFPPGLRRGGVDGRLTPQLSHAAAWQGGCAAPSREIRGDSRMSVGSRGVCGACLGGLGFSSLPEPGNRGRVGGHLVRVLKAV